MADITMCINDFCELRPYCYRATATPGIYQSVGKFEGGKNCKDFWDNGKLKKGKDKDVHKNARRQ